MSRVNKNDSFTSNVQNENPIEPKPQVNQSPKEYSYGFLALLKSIERYLTCGFNSTKRREIIIKEFANTSISDISKLKNRSAEVKTALLTSDTLSSNQKIALYDQNKEAINTYVEKHKLEHPMGEQLEHPMDEHATYNFFECMPNDKKKLIFYDLHKDSIKKYAKKTSNEQAINAMIVNYIFSENIKLKEKVNLLVKYSDEVNAYIAQNEDALIRQPIKNIYSNFSLNSKQKELLETKYNTNILK